MAENGENLQKDQEGNWARPVSRLKVKDIPQGATGINLDGRPVYGALQGFGKMWQKTYRVRLSGANVTPEEVMKVWKENFPKFQPPENHFYPSMAGVKPGEVLFISTRLRVLPGLPGIIPFSSGVMILYADDTSFTVMTPEGFPDYGWNTFSTYDDDGTTVAQVQSFVRAADPIYEFGNYFMGGAELQERTWQHVLSSLAEYFGVRGYVQFYKVCLDPRFQWSEARHIWRNAAIRTFFYVLSSPIRWVQKQLQR